MILNKKLVLVAVSALLSSYTFAQNAAVVSAYNYNKSYERDKDCDELKKGINSILPATKHDKTSNWSKTWFYGGNLHFNAMIADEACRSKFPNSMQNAFDYYMNALKYNIKDPSAKELDLSTEEGIDKLKMLLDDKGTSYTDRSYQFDILNQKFPYVANAFINAGVTVFQEGEYKKAREYSENSITVNKLMGRVDTLGIYNSTLASQNLEDFDLAIDGYNKLIGYGYGGANMYLYLANIYGDKGDTSKKREIINNALMKYPTNSDLLIENLNFLLKSGQSEKAMEIFDKAITSMPNNASLYYNRGYTYEHSLKDLDKASADYKKAFEIDPQFFDAIYSLGAMYYNKGVEWNNKASSYGLNETSKYEAAIKSAKENFSLAEPALESAHNLNPKDIQTIGSLVSIYSRTGNETKYNEMKGKLEELQK